MPDMKPVTVLLCLILLVAAGCENHGILSGLTPANANQENQDGDPQKKDKQVAPAKAPSKPLKLSAENQRLLGHEIYIISMSSRFKGRNDVYISMEMEDGLEFYERSRLGNLLVTVLSTYIFMNLEVSDPPMLMGTGYKNDLLETAKDALSLLELGSPEEFLATLRKETHLVGLYENNRDYKFAAKLLDPKTGDLLPEFSEYLKTVFAFDKHAQMSLPSK